MITIPFEKSDGINSFRDALLLDDEHLFSDAEIEAMKQQRFDDWLTIINTLPFGEAINGA